MGTVLLRARKLDPPRTSGRLIYLMLQALEAASRQPGAYSAGKTYQGKRTIIISGKTNEHVREIWIFRSQAIEYQPLESILVPIPVVYIVNLVQLISQQEKRWDKRLYQRKSKREPIEKALHLQP